MRYHIRSFLNKSNSSDGNVFLEKSKKFFVNSQDSNVTNIVKNTYKKITPVVKKC